MDLDFLATRCLRGWVKQADVDNGRRASQPARRVRCSTWVTLDIESSLRLTSASSDRKTECSGVLLGAE